MTAVKIIMKTLKEFVNYVLVTARNVIIIKTVHSVIIIILLIL